MIINHPKSRPDRGVCQYRDCERDIPDGITIQLCAYHLRTAYAAYIITTQEIQ